MADASLHGTTTPAEQAGAAVDLDALAAHLPHLPPGPLAVAQDEARFRLWCEGDDRNVLFAAATGTTRERAEALAAAVNALPALVAEVHRLREETAQRRAHEEELQYFASADLLRAERDRVRAQLDASIAHH